MMLESNYDNRLAGRGDDVNAGVAKCKKIISKHNSKLEKMGRRKKSGVLYLAPSAGTQQNRSVGASEDALGSLLVALAAVWSPSDCLCMRSLQILEPARRLGSLSEMT